jgi:hypothetical protein
MEWLCGTKDQFRGNVHRLLVPSDSAFDETLQLISRMRGTLRFDAFAERCILAEIKRGLIAASGLAHHSF